MHTVSTLRLTLLRASYALIALGLAQMIGPLILNPPPDLERMRGVVWSLLSVVGLLSILGVRYPLRMLPILVFEFTWKLVWLVTIGLPKWTAGTLTMGETQTWWECVGTVAVLLLVIPWGYVARTYVTGRGDPWSGGRRADVSKGEGLVGELAGSARFAPTEGR